jgi:hypothetical protein
MTNGNDMALVSSCANILLSPACQSISFHWLGQFVNGKGYREVTFALFESRISLVTGPLSGEVKGQYDFDDNSFTLKSPFNPKDLFRQMNVVHEATHAIQDIECHGAWLARWDIEAAAYVAGWFYFLNSNPDNAQWSRRSTKPRAVLALEIAGKIKFEGEASISSNLMNQLSDAIINDPLYHDDIMSDPFIHPDGIGPSHFP